LSPRETSMRMSESTRTVTGGRACRCGCRDAGCAHTPWHPAPGAVFPDSQKGLHRLPPLIQLAEVALPGGLADQLGDGRAFAARASAQNAPEILIQIKLSPPHGVYHTSSKKTRAEQVNWDLPKCFAFFAGGARAQTGTTMSAPPRGVRSSECGCRYSPGGRCAYRR
jgi:hypothetical protein